MTDPRRMWTAVGAILLLAVGIVIGGGASAWTTRDRNIAPWRKIRVEHEGVRGATTRTRVVFANPKLPLQAVEVTRSPDGEAERALIALLDGTELTAGFEGGLPSTLEGPDGNKALFSFKGQKARVAFIDAKGKSIGDKVVTVAVELGAALTLAQAEPASASSSRFAELLDTVSSALVGEAHAQEKEEVTNIDIVRDFAVGLNVALPGAKPDAAGNAQVDASCQPFTCLVSAGAVKTPGESDVRITVAGSQTKASLPEPAGASALAAFKDEAKKEREEATRVLPVVARVIAAAAVTRVACRSLDIDWPICAEGLTKSAASGAVAGVEDHEVDVSSHILDERAEALYYQEQARRALDQEVAIEVCVSRDGYTRACSKIKGHPFGEERMESKAVALELRRGIGGTLSGSHVLTQSDGADCKFSPSPKATGSVQMSFASDTGVLSATLKADERGTRSNLRCSMGNANMSWTQNYTITVSQTFTKEQLNRGGKLPLRLTGEMKGVGSYSFSNCRSSGGVSGSCPGGKREAYSYPAELVGELDLDTQKGGGNIVVSKAPLGTRGTWQVPAAGGTP